MTLDSAELDTAYELLIRLIKNAGDLAMEGYHSTAKHVETKQGPYDLVTYYDKAVEKLLNDGIHEQYPSHK